VNLVEFINVHYWVVQNSRLRRALCARLSLADARPCLTQPLLDVRARNQEFAHRKTLTPVPSVVESARRRLWITTGRFATSSVLSALMWSCKGEFLCCRRSCLKLVLAHSPLLANHELKHGDCLLTLRPNRFVSAAWPRSALSISDAYGTSSQKHFWHRIARSNNRNRPVHLTKKVHCLDLFIIVQRLSSNRVDD
jgi:hypothetical protein